MPSVRQLGAKSPLENTIDMIAKYGEFTDRFVPVNLELHNGKKVAHFPDNWTERSFTKWDSKNSVALKTGNGLVVIDIDTKDLSLLDSNIRKLVEQVLEDKNTFIVETTKGYHLYYRTDKNFASNVGISSCIDVRADGGCVFCYTTIVGLSYKVYSDTEPAKLPSEFEKLLKSKTVTSYTYNEEGVRMNSKPREKANPALFGAVESGDINRIIKACGMSVDNFVDGQRYVNFNRFAFILANEPSIQNENVESILKLLVEEVLEFEWSSDTTQKFVKQSLNNMIWAPECFEPRNTSIEVYLHGDHYIVINDNIIFNGISRNTAGVHWIKAGFDKNEFVNNLKIAYEVSYEIDFFQPSAHNFKNDVLYIVRNPIQEWKYDIKFDEDLIADYEQKVMNNQLKELIKLIVWSMKVKESKMNKLLLVGPSNKGKTELARIMGFIMMSAKEFVSVLDGTKWSQAQSDELMKSGLLLADDIEHDLPLTIKNISSSIGLYVAYKGQTIHPMKFLIMTSTHDSVAGTMNEELKNRILIMEISGKYTLNDSPFFQKDMEHYREQTEAYIKKLIIEAINVEFSMEEFRTLQDKFRAPETNERDEILEVIRKKIIEWVRGGVFDGVKQYDGCYIIERKKDLKKFILEIIDEEFDGHRVDKTKECSYLMKEFISDKQDITHRVNGKVTKFYTVYVDAKSCS